ncbi:VWA domain-containing protein [Hydrogenophaga sp. 5NK40-0174]
MTMADWPVQFIWPELLWSLLLLPVVMLSYVWILRRRRKMAVQFASLSLVRQAMAGRVQWRRHVPPVLMLLALVSLLLAAARPVAMLTLPTRDQTIILAMDVSGSMRATDVKPSRLEASQEAAKSFIKGLPPYVKVGIVAFAGTAQVVQPATLRRQDLYAAIDKFQLQRATATGSALVVALAELFPDHGIDLGQLSFQAAGIEDPLQSSRDADREAETLAKPHTPVEPGSYGSAAIILLTDGQRTTGFDTEAAAEMAAERGVRVYTVGVGTVEGEVIGFDGWTMRVRLDEDSLKQMSDATRGEYFHAGTADNLRQVYESLGTRLTVETKETEVSAVLALLGAMLMLMAAALSMWWHNRLA